MADFEESFFFNEINQFVGSGAEVLLKGSKNQKSSATRVEIGDRFIGIGFTHTVETLSRPPGPNTFRAFDQEPGNDRKVALRAFEVAQKNQVDDGFEFALTPLSPADYSEAISIVTKERVRIAPDTIPEGTMILSFIQKETTYSLERIADSPEANWVAALQGTRHWNVGIGKRDDFWAAKLPADDIEMISQVPSSMTIGTISFGLSLLSGSNTSATFGLVSCFAPSGKPSEHQFCLSGRVVGTQGLNTPFPIGLRTRIVFHPERSD